MGEKFFDCDRCGLCCQRVNKSAIYIELNRGDGVCKNFDEETKLCKIYYNRPLFCNVDAYYDKYLSQLMTRQEFHEMNHKACEIFKAEAKNYD